MENGECLREEAEIEVFKENFFNLTYLQSEQLSVKATAKMFDTILVNKNGDTDEIREKQMNAILTEEHLIKAVESILEDEQYRYLTKEVMKLGMIAPKK